MATGSAGRLQPTSAGQGAGDCSSTEQSQQVPTGKASSPIGDIRFITWTSKLGSPNILEPSLCNPCQLLAESHGKEKCTLKSGDIFQWWQSCSDCPGSFPCHLTWAMNFLVYVFICRNYSRIKGFLQVCIAGICCAQPGRAHLFSWCKSLQLHRCSHVTEKNLLPPLGPAIPFLTWATPTPPGLRDESLPLSGKQENSFSFQSSKTTTLHLPASLTHIASSFLSIQDSKLVSPQRTHFSACWPLLGPAVWLCTISWDLLLVRNKKSTYEMLQRRADKEHGQLSSFVILYSIVNTSCTYLDVFIIYCLYGLCVKWDSL